MARNKADHSASKRGGRERLGAHGDGRAPSPRARDARRGAGGMLPAAAAVRNALAEGLSEPFSKANGLLTVPPGVAGQCAAHAAHEAPSAFAEYS